MGKAVVHNIGSAVASEEEAEEAILEVPEAVPGGGLMQDKDTYLARGTRSICAVVVETRGHRTR